MNLNQERMDYIESKLGVYLDGEMNINFKNLEVVVKDESEGKTTQRTPCIPRVSTKLNKIYKKGIQSHMYIWCIFDNSATWQE